MAKVMTKIQTLAGRKPADVLNLSAQAALPTASAGPAASGMRLLQYKDTLSLSAAALAPAAVTPAPNRVQPVGLRPRVAVAFAAAPAVSPTPFPAAPAPAATVTAPAAAAYAVESKDAQVAAAIAQAPDAASAFLAAEKLLIAELEKRHTQPADKPADHPIDVPGDVPKPAKPEAAKPDAGDADKLKTMTTEELARLGREDKKGFFEALRPAAEQAEKEYGVPAAITLAQAALETGWGAHIIPGFNLFGIKGTGPAGTVAKGTWEVYDGKKVTITANFAKYHDFHEAVKLHGKLFHNGYYDKAMEQYAKDKDPIAFGRNITGTYATDPSYGDKLSSIMRDYDLV